MMAITLAPLESSFITSAGTLFTMPPSTCRSPFNTTGGYMPGALPLARMLFKTDPVV